MEIDTRTGANAVGGNGVTGPEPELDRDAFMQLLVTQIRNQDPLDPMETRDMMAQLTELSSVEHLIGIEERIATLQVGTASIANAQVADFVGKTVTADASSLRLEETGDAGGAFTLEGRASQVTATVRNAEGEVVREIELGEAFPGGHTFQWDGRDADGIRLPAGRYQVELSAVGPDGGTVPVAAEVSGVVRGISYEHGYPELLVGDSRVLLGDVREVQEGRGATPSALAAPDPAEETAEESDPPNPLSDVRADGSLTLTNPEAAIASYTR